MNFKTNPTQIIRSACALGLAGIMTASSIITVAAAVQATIDSNQASENDNISLTEQLVVSSSSNDNPLLVGAYTVTFIKNDETVSVIADEGISVEQALERAKITLSDNQICSVSLNTKVTKDLEVKILDAKEISVTADGDTKTAVLPLGNIVDALNISGYKLSDEDILSVSKDSKVEDIDKVTIQRVTYKTKASTEKIAFESVTENSDEVELGEKKVKTEGEDGEKEITTQYKYVDGKLTEEKVISERTVKEPVDEVTLIGTKGTDLENVAGTFTDSDGNTVAYSQVLTGSGTAYTASAGSLTATGVTAYFGGVAVNPNIIPYGSKLYIVSTDGSFVYGYATAVDTGGALMAGTAIVDCFYDTYDECVSFGRRDVNVYIVG